MNHPRKRTDQRSHEFSDAINKASKISEALSKLCSLFYDSDGCDIAAKSNGSIYTSPLSQGRKNQNEKRTRKDEKNTHL